MLLDVKVVITSVVVVVEPETHSFIHSFVYSFTHKYSSTMTKTKQDYSLLLLEELIKLRVDPRENGIMTAIMVSITVHILSGGVRVSGAGG